MAKKLLFEVRFSWGGFLGFFVLEFWFGHPKCHFRYPKLLKRPVLAILGVPKMAGTSTRPCGRWERATRRGGWISSRTCKLRTTTISVPSWTMYMHYFHLINLCQNCKNWKTKLATKYKFYGVCSVFKSAAHLLVCKTLSSICTLYLLFFEFISSFSVFLFLILYFHWSSICICIFYLYL